MKIDRISYKKIFPLGNYVNETIGMEAQIDDGEDVQAKMLTLKNLVEDFHKRNNPVEVAEDQPVVVQQIEKRKTNIEHLIDDINSCKELKVLESYKLMVRAVPELQEAYNNKLKQLS